MTGNDVRILESFSKVMDLAQYLGVYSIKDYPGCWEHHIDEHWWIAVNGHPETMEANGIKVEPYHVYVEFNGWPAGLFNMRSGSIAAGDLANEQTFIDAIDRAISGSAK